MDGGTWWSAVHGVTKSRTRLSNFTFTFMHWRRKWQSIPVFLPGESQGRGSLVAAVHGVAQSRTRLKQLSSSNASLMCYRIITVNYYLAIFIRVSYKLAYIFLSG